MSLFVGERFGVTVEHYPARMEWDEAERFEVTLPHECGEWPVAESEDINEVSETLSAFIWELRLASDTVEKIKREGVPQ